jgi:putative endonuclease
MIEDNFYVYAIFSQVDNRIYVGMSQNVSGRIQQHNAGKVTSTKHFVPWVLFFSQLAGNTTEARKLEKYFKSTSGKRKLRKILESLNPGSLPA